MRSRYHRPPTRVLSEAMAGHQSRLPLEALVFPSWTLARSRLARAIQTGQPPEAIEAARDEYRAARLAHFITEAVPHLADEQRRELAGLLTAPGGGE